MARIAWLYYADIWCTFHVISTQWKGCYSFSRGSRDRNLSHDLVIMHTTLYLLSRMTNNFWKNCYKKLPCSNMSVHSESNTGPPSSEARCNVHLDVRYCDALSLKIIKQVYSSEFDGFSSPQFFFGWFVLRDVGTGGQCGVKTFSFRN